MLYIEYPSLISPREVVKIVENIHLRYPALDYVEMLDKKPQKRYLFFRDVVIIGHVSIFVGKYKNYDKKTGGFDVLPLFQLRVNPNKYYNEIWFKELLDGLLKCTFGGVLLKYDYAVDVPKLLQYVKVLSTRKEFGLYKGTRYYGQSGRHGYLKIYDKQLELQKQGKIIGTLTRVEHTLVAKAKPSLEDVYLFDDSKLNVDYSKLKDTERAIVEMYLQLKALECDYPLKLGRKMQAKLAPYLSGSYFKLEYGDILNKLIDNVKKVFRCDVLSEREALEMGNDGFIITDEYLQMELEELFGG